MIRGCKKIQGILIDVFYGESQMDEETEAHLKECIECKAFYESLYDLKNEISMFDTAAKVDEQVLRQAFQIAANRQKKRKERIEFAVFLIAAVSIMSVVVAIAAMGHGIGIMIGMMAFAAITSLIIPLFFIRRLVGEGA
jgi:predicted anti-sigma-YlaC factor YlaD